MLTLEKLKKINRGLEIQLSNDTEMDAFLQFLHQSGEAVYYRYIIWTEFLNVEDLIFMAILYEINRFTDFI